VCYTWVEGRWRGSAELQPVSNAVQNLDPGGEKATFWGGLGGARVLQFQAWSKLAQDYSRRNLTFRADKAMAIQGHCRSHEAGDWVAIPRGVCGRSHCISRQCMYERFPIQSHIASDFCGSFGVKQHSLFPTVQSICPATLPCYAKPTCHV